MRLDKFFSDMGILSRRDCARAVSRGEITVNGKPAARADAKVDEHADVICYRTERVTYARFVYVMLHKPQGYISATEDGNAPVVTELLPETLRRRELFPCGRLDKDTTGFLLLTDDGALAHRLLSPKRHVSKIYAFTLDAPLPEGAETRFAAGVRLGEEVCRPATLALTPERTSGRITIVEGKYHQIKRMMASEGCTVTALHRACFAGIPLDGTLAPGAWRHFTPAEIEVLQNAPKK